VPLGFAFARERHVLKIEYCRSVANEIVDGEMEILAAGAAKESARRPANLFRSRQRRQPVAAGTFSIDQNANHLRLEWTPDKKRGVKRRRPRKTRSMKLPIAISKTRRRAGIHAGFNA